ncbi:flagellar hook protein FlgE [Bacillus ectoiniformans]|uniref:flagellar basal body rod protein FlgG n=1 Tax=Bacillus ectoiniformans TaxID=1494429 RepID=UPI00195ECA53|nr:flagellar basal body rod protein FlgG [Bacillus ectoiniformans]MBM7647125.1 flagellar hook protein FlgE [Bacillus ectoiniformans]
MLRSMYSGISGMKGFQTKLDVIGNNISNVNTFGYKKGRVTFKDMVSQQISGATGPGTIGGTNPKQVGLGTQISTIDTIHTQGSLQTTARPLDLGISGDGFFVLKKGTETLYTRSGNFYLDKDGSIVNGDGYYLQGGTNTANPQQIKIGTAAQSFSIGADGSISVVGDTATNAPILLAKFPNPDGLQKAGQNNFIETANSGEPDLNNPGVGGNGTLVAGALEMSNVDLSEEFTEMIVAQRGFQANTRIITTSDEILQELVNLKR